MLRLCLHTRIAGLRFTRLLLPVNAEEPVTVAKENEKRKGLFTYIDLDTGDGGLRDDFAAAWQCIWVTHMHWQKPHLLHASFCEHIKGYLRFTLNQISWVNNNYGIEFQTIFCKAYQHDILIFIVLCHITFNGPQIRSNDNFKTFSSQSLVLSSLSLTPLYLLSFIALLPHFYLLPHIFVIRSWMQGALTNCYK